MKDRVPNKPNRYAVYDDNHNFSRYEYHERADEPTQEGSALNKANLLPDNVATVLGLAGDPQVKDAFTALKTLADTKTKIEAGLYAGTGTYGSANKNSLTFGFIPTVVFISFVTTIGGAGNMTIDSGLGGAHTMFHPRWMLEKQGVNSNQEFTVVWGNATTNTYAEKYTISDEGKTIAWYNTDSASQQLNGQNSTYYYVAIG